MPPRKSKSKSKSKGRSSAQGERHLRKKQNDKLRAMQAAGVQGLSAVIDPSLSAATETVAATVPQRGAKGPDEEAKGKSNSTEWEAIVRQAFVERKAAHKGVSMTADAIVELDEAQQAEVERRFQAWLASKKEKVKTAQEVKEAAEAEMEDAKQQAQEAKLREKEAVQRANAKEWEFGVQQALLRRKAVHKGASMTADAFVKLDEAKQAEVERRFQA
jgi:hypothetical protein